MPTVSITKQFRFEAAHQLLNHDGKCREPHGHSYLVEVEVEGPVKGIDGQSDEGMVADFGVISDIWKHQVEPHLDHRDLNQTIGGVTTAENIARWTFDQFEEYLILPIFCRLTAVTVWETATSRARVEV